MKGTFRFSEAIFGARNSLGGPGNGLARTGNYGKQLAGFLPCPAVRIGQTKRLFSLTN